MNKFKGAKKKLHRLFVPPSNPATVVHPDLRATVDPDGPYPPTLVPLDTTNVAFDIPIATFRSIKEIAGAIPTIGGPLKATCGIMIRVLETIEVIITTHDDSVFKFT
jgi:hypothetical protein